MPRPVKLVLNTLAIALVAGLVAVFGWRQATAGKSPKAALAAGKVVPAPPFELGRAGGGTLSLASLRGHPVVLNFWATWCEPCKKESAELEKVYRQNRERGLVVVGVDTSDLSGDTKRFIAKHGLTYPIVHDKGTQVATRYGVIQVPETFFVDKRGRLVGDYVAGGINASDTLHEQFQAGLARLLGRA